MLQYLLAALTCEHPICSQCELVYKQGDLNTNKEHV